MESYISFSIISVFFYTFMILTLLAGKRSRIINSFMCVLGGMLCWTLGSFLMRMEAGPSYILWYYVSLAGILFLPYFYMCSSVNSWECVWAEKARSHCF